MDSHERIVELKKKILNLRDKKLRFEEQLLILSKDRENSLNELKKIDANLNYENLDSKIDLYNKKIEDMENLINRLTKIFNKVI